MLDDNYRIFDSKNLLNYENNLYCIPGEVHAIKQDFQYIVPPVREKFFKEYSRDFLKGTYGKLYSPRQVHYVPLRYEEFAQIEVYVQVYTSLKSRSSRSSVILAVWPKLGGKILDRTVSLEDVRSGVVEYFFCHTPTISAEHGQHQQSHIFAKVKWYRPCKKNLV